MDMNTRRLRTIEQLRAFVQGNESVDFQPRERKQAYAFIGEILTRFGYRQLGKSDKGVALRFLGSVTGFSRPQVERLVRQWRQTGHIRERRDGRRGRPFARKYTRADIQRLADINQAYGQMSGLATREILRRQFQVYGDVRYERLASLSNGHLYNLRNSAGYRNQRMVYRKTRPTPVPIGLRQAPQPQGQPGHVRVDTVHQGDRDGVKGLYWINLVDEVTQFQLIGAVPAISEHFLVPQLEGLLRSFPFPILGFHADNGSEYINYRVATLLHKLQVGRFTKSRPRRTNDNALVEGKNAHVVRRWFGHDHIPQRFASTFNRFAQGTLSPFLNFHRPCLFATLYRDAKGKLRHQYRAEDVMTPYDRLRSLPDAESYLEPGQDFDKLQALAHFEDDLQAAQRVQSELQTVFQRIYPTLYNETPTNYAHTTA